MMELENGMVSGAMPYNQSDAPAKAIKCPWCRQEVDEDENMYGYSGEYVCADCVKADVGNMSPDELAGALGMTRVKPRRFAIGEDMQEQDYLRIEREGIQDEGYWAAVNGTEFETEGYENE